ncbi:MAG: hypothetical protein ACLFTQ_02105 [Candidatus Aenigmatarchaeota archaeon]
MKVEIKERKDNPLLERKEIKGTIDHEGEATPSIDSLEGYLSEELGTDKENIQAEKIFTIKGTQKSKFWAKELGGVSGVETKEEKTKDVDGNYEEVLSGTIAEAKEEIEEMDKPDFELLLETEKQNKDRKGMKKYLKGKTGE